MNAAETIEGFWAQPANFPTVPYHFFIEGEEASVCGKWRIPEMGESHQMRRPGNDDCLKCIDIHRELFVINPTPQVAQPPWTVETDILGEGAHILYYLGKEQSRQRGPTGLKTQNEIAAMCNKNGTVPKNAKKPKCAADAPSPSRFLEKKSNQSPELPLQTPSPTPTPTMSKKTNSASVEIAAPIVEIFPASHFRRYPTNRIISEEAIKNMEASERESGILDPLLVRAIPGETELEIINGETRWLGAKRIDPEYPIPCFVRTLTDKEAAALHAISNFQRTDLNPFEEGREISHMRDCGWEMIEIANHLGKGENWLYKRLSLLKLPEEGKSAFLEGNLSLHTAMKILSLPEEKQVEAVKAVSNPTHAASALPEREAMELIDDDFVKPLQKAAEWEERRDLLEKENPGCQWLKYEHAIKAGDHHSGYVRADYQPSRDILSDAAKLDELVVPKWKELAIKHGSPIYIGLYRFQPKEAFLYVSPEAIIEAEKAAHNENPNDCIFSHEKAVQKNRDDAAKRKMDEEQRKEALKLHQEAINLERRKFAAMVLAPDGIGKAATKKLIESIFEEMNENGDDDSDLADALGIDTELSCEEWREKTSAALLKYLRSKAFTPFEAMGRLKLASYISNRYSFITQVMFTSGACKPADFPAFHYDYLKRIAYLAKEEANGKEREAADQPEFADGEPESNQDHAA